jgi:crotonobetainyl-CoA:carnitine CoA-transferase CaiB-like acyl-CoA transferase
MSDTPHRPRSDHRGPLQGLLVLDFGQAAVGPVAAEYCGMMGATVIKVESPTGDTVRRGVPTMRGTSTTFLGNNLTKFGIVLDLKSSEGNRQAKRLIAIADALIENFRSNDVMVRLGLGYDVLKALNPNLVYVSSSAYGSGGPLENMRSNEWLTEAFSGFTSVTGAKGSAGEFSRGSANLDWNGAMINSVVMLAALYRRSQGGGGCYLLTSQLGSSLYGGVTRFAEVLAGQTPSGPLGAASPFAVPDDIYRTTDGFLAVTATDEATWVRLCEAIGLDELGRDHGFASNQARLERRDAVTERLAGAFAHGSNAVWCAKLEAADVPCAPVPQGATLLDALQSHPQVHARNLVQYVASHYGRLASQAPHWTFAETPASIDAGPPLLGEHTELVLAHLDTKTDLMTALAERRRLDSQEAA